jgi:hypothetical protein
MSVIWSFFPSNLLNYYDTNHSTDSIIDTTTAIENCVARETGADGTLQQTQETKERHDGHGTALLVHDPV